MRLAIFGAALLGLILSTTAEASPHHKPSHRNHYTHGSSHHHRAHYRTHRKTHHRRSNSDYRVVGTQYLPHPPGCPHTAFCGCGAYRALTGQTVTKGTWAIANYWRDHYKGSIPVAWWNHHVAIVREFLGNGLALVEDYNSGEHRSRLHIRNISRAKILGGFSHYAMN